MPLVEVKMLDGRTDEQKRELASRITKVMVEVAKAEKDAVTVIFWETGGENWAKGGKCLADT